MRGTKIFTVIAFSAMVLMSDKCKAQEGERDRVISMLKEFYAAYSKASFGIEDQHKVDSLHDRYCTPQLRSEAKKYLEDGHDLLTDDWGISTESLPSMTIVRDEKETTYVVSYIVDSYPVSPYKPVKKQVVLHVSVVKDGENYKIASIE